MADLSPKQNESNDFESDFNLVQLFDLLYKIDRRVNAKNYDNNNDEQAEF